MRARETVRKVIDIIRKPEMRILPGQLAFFLVLSLIPLLALVGAIGSSFGISIVGVKDALEKAVPEAVLNVLMPETINSTGLNFNVIVFFVAAFLLASNGAYSMIITSNEIYQTGSFGEIKRRAKAIIMTFIFVFLILFLFLVPAFGDLLVELVKLNIHNGRVAYAVQTIYNLAKYPISIFLLYFNIKLLYTLGPDQKVSSRSIIPGAIFTTIMWLISSRIYAFYVTYFSHYDLFYGSMSNLLVLLFWVYILSYIFTLGMSFNATGVLQETLEFRKIESKKKEE